jgi:Zn finger protein HypA/HybF involved in hydrogenase expression
MKLSTVYCPGCNHKVRLTMTQEHRAGQASLPDGGDVVCLDFGEGCSEGSCPLTGRPGLVMGVRLAKSHLPHEARTLVAHCDACGDVAEMEVLDRTHAVCSICESTNEYVIVPVDETHSIAVTRR